MGGAPLTPTPTGYRFVTCGQSTLAMFVLGSGFWFVACMIVKGSGRQEHCHFLWYSLSTKHMVIWQNNSYSHVRSGLFCILFIPATASAPGRPVWSLGSALCDTWAVSCYGGSFTGRQSRWMIMVRRSGLEAQSVFRNRRLTVGKLDRQPETGSDLKDLSTDKCGRHQ